MKTELRQNVKGKKYHKTNNCVVCKSTGVCKQILYIFAECNVPICCPLLTERNSAPTDCFRKYHERLINNSMISSESDDYTLPYKDKDDFDDISKSC